jgi:hypothetical protein
MGKKGKTKRLRRIKRKRTIRGRGLRGGAEVDETGVLYVSSRGILKSCDVKPSDISSSTGTASIDISRIKDGSTVYVHGSAIPDLVKKMDSIQSKFILISGDCDESIPDAVFSSEDDFKKFIESEKIMHWYSQNAVNNHSKLTRIPIGLDYHTLPGPAAQEKELIGVKDAAPPLAERKLQCYSNFHFSKQADRKFTYDRDDAMAGVPKELVYYEPEKVSRTDTWKNQAQYAFVLSPHGNGLDCHRTWEALCLGCIPIVKTSLIDKVFEDLPVLIVKDWPEVTNELLSNTLSSFSQKNFNMERLTLAFWMDLIRSK